MESSSWVPEGVDVQRPSVARMYDALLGGRYNFTVDRDLARKTIALDAGVQWLAKENRAFLGRAVRYLLDAGVRQFLDIGSGIPTEGNVHEVAHQGAPDARVVYVDHDPVAVAHSKAILDGNDRATIINADLRQPGDILGHPRLAGLLDFEQPIAVLLVAILHYVPEDADPYAIMRQLRDAIAPGSYLAISHVSYEGDPETAKRGERLFEQAQDQLRTRSRTDIRAMFGDMELVEPGLVELPSWRPDPGVSTEYRANAMVLGAVGHKSHRR